LAIGGMAVASFMYTSSGRDEESSVAPLGMGEESSVYDGFKGAAPPPAGAELSMSFAVARGGQVVRPGQDGDLVLDDADLLFRFRVEGAPRHLYLVQENDGRRDLVWPLPEGTPTLLSGEVDLAVDGVVHGVPLAGLEGVARFTVVGSQERLADPLAALQPISGTVTATVTVRVAQVPR